MHCALDSYVRGGGSLAFLILFLLAAFSGCSRKPSSDPEVWAEVDGQPILRPQVEKHYRRRLTAGSDAANPEQALNFKLTILNELINNQILLAQASRSRITVSEAEVDTKVAELQSPYSKEEFQGKLKEQGLDPGDLRQEVRQGLFINKLIVQDITSRIAVTDAEIREYYEHNKTSFNVPETQYRLAQIAVTATADPQVRNLKNDDAKNPMVAERKIRALYARLNAGENFATVAQEYSEDPRTASSGGDMGFLPDSSLDSIPGLKQAVLSLKQGQISGIIPTQGGYHIIKLLGREERGQREFSDPGVQGAIRRTLRNEKEQLLKAAYIENLRNRAKVVNYLAERIVTAGANPVAIK